MNSKFSLVKSGGEPVQEAIEQFPDEDSANYQIFLEYATNSEVQETPDSWLAKTRPGDNNIVTEARARNWLIRRDAVIHYLADLATKRAQLSLATQTGRLIPVIAEMVQDLQGELTRLKGRGILPVDASYQTILRQAVSLMKGVSSLAGPLSKQNINILQQNNQAAPAAPKMDFAAWNNQVTPE